MKEYSIKNYSKKHRINLIRKWRANADHHRSQVRIAEHENPELQELSKDHSETKAELCKTLGENLVLDYIGIVAAIEACEAKLLRWEAEFLKDFGHPWNQV
jgi:hypothetical protein